MNNILPYSKFKSYNALRITEAVTDTADFGNDTPFSQSLVGRFVNRIFSKARKKVAENRLISYKNQLQDEYLAGVLRALAESNVKPEQISNKYDEMVASANKEYESAVAEFAKKDKATLTEDEKVKILNVLKTATFSIVSAIKMRINESADPKQADITKAVEVLKKIREFLEANSDVFNLSDCYWYAELINDEMKPYLSEDLTKPLNLPESAEEKAYKESSMSDLERRYAKYGLGIYTVYSEINYDALSEQIKKIESNTMSADLFYLLVLDYIILDCDYRKIIIQYNELLNILNGEQWDKIKNNKESRESIVNALNEVRIDLESIRNLITSITDKTISFKSKKSHLISSEYDNAINTNTIDSVWNFFETYVKKYNLTNITRESITFVELKNITHEESGKKIHDFENLNDKPDYNISNVEDSAHLLDELLAKKEKELKDNKNIDVTNLKVQAVSAKYESLNEATIANTLKSVLPSRFRNTTSIAVLGDAELVSKFKNLDLAHVDNAKVQAIFKADPKMKERATALVNKYRIAEIQLSAQRIYGRSEAGGRRLNLVITDNDKVMLENLWKRLVAKEKGLFMYYLDMDMLDPIRIANTDETLRGQIAKIEQSGAATTTESKHTAEENTARLQNKSELDIILGAFGVENKPINDNSYGIIRGFIPGVNQNGGHIGLVVKHLVKTLSTSKKYQLYVICKLMNLENIISKIKDTKKPEITKLIRENSLPNDKSLIPFNNYYGGKIITQNSIKPENLVSFLLYTGNNINTSSQLNNFYLFHYDISKNMMYINLKSKLDNPTINDVKNVVKIDNNYEYTMRPQEVWQILPQTLTDSDNILGFPFFNNDKDRTELLLKQIESAAFDIPTKLNKK